MALQNTSLWVHNGKGERQISLEGNGTDAKFTPDGKKLCYLIVREAPNDFTWYRNLGELQIADVESGRSEPLVPGFSVLDYDVSADGRHVVMSTTDSEGRSRLWVCAVPIEARRSYRSRNRRGRVSSRFGPDGEVFFSQVGRDVHVCLPRAPRRQRTAKGARRTGVPAVGVFHPDGRWIVGWERRFPVADHPQFRLFRWTGGCQLSKSVTLSLS